MNARSRKAFTVRHRLFLLVAAAGLLAGCFGHNPFATQRPATAAEKHTVIQTARNELYDPFSIRSAELSTVITIGDGREARRVVCARFDSRTRDGGYTGVETHLITLDSRERVLAALVVPATEAPCDRLRYAPFPEAEGLRRAARGAMPLALRT